MIVFYGDIFFYEWNYAIDSNHLLMPSNISHESVKLYFILIRILLLLKTTLCCCICS